MVNWGSETHAFSREGFLLNIHQAPACSSGGFLSALQTSAPLSLTVGL